MVKDMFFIKYKKFFIIILTLFLLLLSKPWFTTNYISVSFNQKASQPIEYQVFYVNDGTYKVTEKQSVKYKTNNKNVKIKVFENEIKLFRLDIGVKPGIVEISDLKINSKSLDLNKFSKSKDVESLIVENNKMIIKSDKNDPYLVYKTDVNETNTTVLINYPILIMLLCFWLALSWVLVSFVSNKNNKTDAIFVLLFGILICIPMLHISNAEKSEQENRMLAKSPDLFVDDDINNKYGIQFNDWFNDRFFGRKHFIRLYSHIKKSMSVDNDKVLQGKDDWLFYKGDKSLENFQNKNLFSDEQLKHFAEYLSDINNWAIKNGKSFYYVIAPDKNKIYGENITVLKKFRPDTDSRTNQLVKYLHTNTNVTVIYLYDVIMQNKDNGLLYYKNDTHWNDFGAYIGYQEIINQIKKKHKQIIPVVYTETDKNSHEYGDLTKMLGNSGKKDLTEYIHPIIKDNAKCKYKTDDKNQRNGFICYNKNKKLNVFILRDSFFEAPVRYFNNTFNTVKYEWRYDITKDDLQYIKNNSDIIILEQVERFIPKLYNKSFPKE